ncbi:MAG: type II secretion system F family protein [Maricaulis sp.]|jgi:tight adherence protein B|uniref:type II secretion system F family protein n=1 Tax=Maricaulis sp. TaxID=1486257 RepID=UPI001B2A12A9|nr:type II secretion system F family protein [Maricaulis sp.]MBO6730767.1 type II secretion system F family protein [Maricaulis sp.]MBO6845887.1 type II secretion system F family protein [Maricaulis sp.]MBO6878710.1 type II secretion system F family protein [Maricaulis sp.]
MNGDILFILAAAAAFVAVGGVGWVAVGAMGDAQSKQRVTRAVGGASAARTKRGNGPQDQAAQRRKQISDSLKDIEQKQKDQRAKSISLKSRIQQAGMEFSPTAFWIGSLVSALVVAAIAFFTGQGLLVVGGATIVGGLGLPRWWLGFLRGSRQKKFTQEFANSLDVIVRGVKSGLPLNECLKIIANESPDPVGSEFKQLCDGIAMGVSLEENLNRMCERMPLAELNFFRTVLIIQQKTGGNLAETLGNLSIVLRSRKLMREKISALSSEAKSSAAIIGSLPPGVLGIVYATTPSYMNLMFVHPTGQLMLLGGATWMFMGIMVMRGMINFKI